jgi:glycogen synthase
MHLLITTDAIGGVWTYTQELVTGLIARGHRVTLVSFGKLPTLQQTAWMRALPRLEFHPTEYRLEWMEVAERDIEESRGYLELLVREVQPDVLHFSQYCYGNLKVDVPRIVVAHSDVATWWVGVHGCEPEPSPWMRRYREHVMNGLHGADLVVAPSQWMLDAVSQYYGTVRDGRVIYNGRDPELFNPGHPKKEIAISVGRVWDEGKHVALLLQQEPPLPTHIVGWEQEPGREKRQLPKCPVNVHFLGAKSQAELREIYASGAIYVATSRYEPFGLAPLEAALSRCALVMNDIPVFHELWGEDALYFRRDNPADLTRVLGELRSNTDLQHKMGSRALERARQRFSASRMVEEYESAYQQIALSLEKVG